ncbi:hypothetical protein GCM10020367_07230 [Streptomyces sannanensis]|uniref:Uncharacterized protein n=1 Tax=Streptomyces sannanensis TaxID=285536 RepID=A0ABP6S5C1_9ACTN
MPQTAQRVLGGLVEGRGGGGIDFGPLGVEQVLNQLGHVLRALTEPERGVQLPEYLFGMVRRHAVDPAITPVGPPPVYPPLTRRAAVSDHDGRLEAAGPPRPPVLTAAAVRAGRRPAR